MHKLEFQRSRQSLGQRVGWDESGRQHFRRVEFRGGAKFLDAHGADGEFAARQPCQQVEAPSAGHAEPIREMGGRDVLAEYLFDVLHEVVHREVGLVHVVVHIVALRAVFDEKFHERHDVAHVGHRFAVVAFAHHQKLAACDLVQQVVDVAAVAFAENHGGAHDVHVPVRMCRVPTLQHLFRLPFRTPVVVERIGRMLLRRVLLVQPVDGHRREEHEPLHPVPLHRPQRRFHPPHVRLIVKLHGADVVVMHRSQQHRDVRALHCAVHVVLPARVADCRDVVEKAAWEQIHVSDLNFLFR